MRRVTRVLGEPRPRLSSAGGREVRANEPTTSIQVPFSRNTHRTSLQPDGCQDVSRARSLRPAPALTADSVLAGLGRTRLEGLRRPGFATTRQTATSEIRRAGAGPLLRGRCEEGARAGPTPRLAKQGSRAGTAIRLGPWEQRPAVQDVGPHEPSPWARPWSCGPGGPGPLCWGRPEAASPAGRPAGPGPQGLRRSRPPDHSFQVPTAAPGRPRASCTTRSLTRGRHCREDGQGHDACVWKARALASPLLWDARSGPQARSSSAWSAASRSFGNRTVTRRPEAVTPLGREQQCRPPGRTTTATLPETLSVTFHQTPWGSSSRPPPAGRACDGPHSSVTEQQRAGGQCREGKDRKQTRGGAMRREAGGIRVQGRILSRSRQGATARVTQP